MQHPVTWQPSKDGLKLVGHMILKKTTDTIIPSAVHAEKGTLGNKSCNYVCRYGM